MKQNKKLIVNCWVDCCVYNKEFKESGVRFCSLNAVFISVNGTCMSARKRKTKKEMNKKNLVCFPTYYGRVCFPARKEKAKE